MEYPKNANMALSEHFTSSEFDCPCDSPVCTMTWIDPKLIELLEKMRVIVCAPLVVERGGGYRCRPYQLELARRGYETAKGISQHERGRAADIHTRGKSSGLELEDVARAVGFRAVGVARVWIHVDLRSECDLRWTYTKRPLHLPRKPVGGSVLP